MIPDRLWLGNFMKLDRYDRHYWSLSPTPTETDLRIWISGPGPTDLKKSRSARARVSRRPRPIPYPVRQRFCIVLLCCMLLSGDWSFLDCLLICMYLSRFTYTMYFIKMISFGSLVIPAFKIFAELSGQWLQCQKLGLPNTPFISVPWIDIQDGSAFIEGLLINVEAIGDLSGGIHRSVTGERVYLYAR